MKLSDFCNILISKTGKRKVLAYQIFDVGILEKYFKECNYKPAVLASKLGLHYQSMRKLLQDSCLWYKVSTKNNRGSGINRKRFKQTTVSGYLYSEDPDNIVYKNGRCRRKLKHIEVMEKHLGRKLNTGEIVHHIDCDKLNNNINNLYVCSREEHGRLHKNLEHQAAILIKRGLIKFNKDHGYYIDSNELIIDD